MLSNKVREVMTANLLTAPVTASVLQVMQKMVGEDVGRIIISDQDVPVGIFTEKDVLRRVVNREGDPANTEIRAVMTTPIRAVAEETRIVDAFSKMYRGRFRHLLVRGRRGRIVGIVSMRRILKVAVEAGQGKNETLTLGDIKNRRASVLDQGASVADTVALMDKENTSAVLIENAGEVMGIFTERDVLKRVAVTGIDPRQIAIREVMTSPPVILSREVLAGEALAVMYTRDIRNMPVRGADGAIMGLLTMPDILRYARGLDIDEQVRQTWKEIADFLDTDDQYTPG